MSVEPIQISGKNLGQLALAAEFCPRCFWLRLHSQQRLPYQIFPGVFSSIDAFTKKVTAAHFAQHHRAPAWFKNLGDIKKLIPVPHHSKFRFMDETTGILLTGAPDDLVLKADETLVVVDYKTARFTENQDSLLPLYLVQLNSYAVIGERIGLGTVSALALIYYEPMTDVGADDVDSVVAADGFAMRFVAKVLPVELALDKIPLLLARVREIYDLQYPPTGRAGCRDCRLLDGLVELLASPLPVEERERLESRLWELRGELEFAMFEQGILSEEVRAHRVALLEADESTRKRDAVQKWLRLEIQAVERQLRGEARGKLSD